MTLEHNIDPKEDQALKDGTIALTKALLLEANKAIMDPAYLDKQYNNVSATVMIPINDGSDDSLYMRGLLYANQVKRDVDSAALSPDELKDQVIAPAAEEAFRSLRFTGKVLDGVNLKLEGDANGPAEIMSGHTDIEVFRVSKTGDIPQSLAEGIAQDADSVAIHQDPKDYWLNSLHEEAVRLSQASPGFKRELQEKITDLQSKGIMRKTDLLPGGVIDIAVLNSRGQQTGEIIASPDKPTVYREF